MDLYFLLFAILLVLLNGFFVAAEFSLVKIRGTQINLLRSRYGYRADIALKINRSQDIYLSACQLGITITSLALGWIGEPAFSFLIYPVLSALSISDEVVVSSIAIIFGFLCITFLHVIVGEVAPKSIAIRSTEKIAMYTSIPLHYFYVISYPLIYTLNSISNLFLLMFGYDNSLLVSNKYSIDEIKLILGGNLSSFSNDHADIVESSFDIRELCAGDLMSPIEELIAINIDSSTTQVLELLNKYKYSRYPIYSNDKKDIIGIVHVKDLLCINNLYENLKKEELINYRREILSIDADCSIIESLKKFRKSSSHFAIVHNTTDRAIGFLTLDNIVSSLIGEIQDEYNQIRNPWIELKNDSLLFKGTTPIYFLEKALDIDTQNNIANTINGLITQKIGRIPKEKEHIYFRDFSIVVKKMRGPHILLVKVIPKETDKQ